MQETCIVAKMLEYLRCLARRCRFEPLRSFAVDTVVPFQYITLQHSNKPTRSVIFKCLGLVAAFPIKLEHGCAGRTLCG